MSETSAFEASAATLADLPRIVALKLAMFKESGHAQLLAPQAEALILRDYRLLYTGGEAQHFVARFDNQVVAIAGAFIKSDIPFRYFRSPIYGFIGDVYTEVGYRRRGLARLLSERGLSWLRSKGVHMVRLLASEAGRCLYDKLGFTSTDEMARVYET